MLRHRKVAIISIGTLLVVSMMMPPSMLSMKRAEALPQNPTLRDPNLKVQVVAEGLFRPTTMAFLGPDDILVLQKFNGTVIRILNGSILDPVLDVNVASKFERGMLGIDIWPTPGSQQNRSAINSSPSTTNKIYVFLYFTEAEVEGSDICPSASYCLPENAPLGNRVYRYEWDNSSSKLVNPVLLLDLPAEPGPLHNGGKLIVGPDNKIYFTIGDLLGHRTATQNYPNTTAFNGSGGIYRITEDGKPVRAILGDESPLDRYYAYGIRNSFGIDFDPVTGRLWDTENGPNVGDEINLVEPGFNSGWSKVQGIWDLNKNGGAKRMAGPNPANLEDFGGKGKYSSPEFTWYIPTGPTAIKFLNSNKLGNQYKNDIFVADFHNGNIYDFKLNQNRTGLVLDGPLSDKISNSLDELEGRIFGKGFNRVTDIQVGLDGYLYIVSLGNGKIYRIVPAT